MEACNFFLDLARSWEPQASLSQEGYDGATATQQGGAASDAPTSTTAVQEEEQIAGVQTGSQCGKTSQVIHGKQHSGSVAASEVAEDGDSEYDEETETEEEGDGTGQVKRKATASRKRNYKRLQKVMLSPTLLRYIEPRRVAFSWELQTVCNFWWPKPMLKEIGEGERKMLLQLKIPAAAATGNVADPASAPAAVSRDASAGPAASGAAEEADEGRQPQGPAGQIGGLCGAAGADMVVVRTLHVLAKSYPLKNQNTHSYHLTQLERQLDPYVNWRVWMLEKVNPLTLAIHMWPPSPQPGVPEPPPVSDQQLSYRSQWLHPEAAAARGPVRSFTFTPAVVAAVRAAVAAEASQLRVPFRLGERTRFKPYVHESPALLRYVEERRIVLEKARVTVKMFNWPRPHLADLPDHLEVMLQVKVPAAAVTERQQQQQQLAEPVAAAAAGTLMPAGGQGGAKGNAGQAAAAAAASGVQQEDTAAVVAAATPAPETGRGAAAAAAAAGVQGAAAVPMVVVKEQLVMLRTYADVPSSKRPSNQLLRLLQVLDEFVTWRVIYLERVSNSLLAIHLWPPQAVEGVPEPPPVPDTQRVAINATGQDVISPTSKKAAAPQQKQQQKKKRSSSSMEVGALEEAETAAPAAKKPRKAAAAAAGAVAGRGSTTTATETPTHTAVKQQIAAGRPVAMGRAPGAGQDRLAARPGAGGQLLPRAKPACMATLLGSAHVFSRPDNTPPPAVKGMAQGSAAGRSPVSLTPAGQGAPSATAADALAALAARAALVQRPGSCSSNNRAQGRAGEQGLQQPGQQRLAGLGGPAATGRLQGVAGRPPPAAAAAADRAGSGGTSGVGAAGASSVRGGAGASSEGAGGLLKQPFLLSSRVQLLQPPKSPKLDASAGGTSRELGPEARQPAQLFAGQVGVNVEGGGSSTRGSSPSKSPKPQRMRLMSSLLGLDSKS